MNRKMRKLQARMKWAETRAMLAEQDARLQAAIHRSLAVHLQAIPAALQRLAKAKIERMHPLNSADNVGYTTEISAEMRLQPAEDVAELIDHIHRLHKHELMRALGIG